MGAARCERTTSVARSVALLGHEGHHAVQTLSAGVGTAMSDPRNQIHNLPEPSTGADAEQVLGDLGRNIAEARKKAHDDLDVGGTRCPTGSEVPATELHRRSRPAVLGVLVAIGSLSMLGACSSSDQTPAPSSTSAPNTTVARTTSTSPTPTPSTVTTLPDGATTSTTSASGDGNTITTTTSAGPIAPGADGHTEGTTDAGT